uniref:BREX system ATP-binding domain-containing protein n=1 Tax=Gemmatimonas sp. TaxID=1962908 RepID=UPI00356AFC25
EKLGASSLPHQGFARAIGLLSEPDSVSGEGRDLVVRFLLGERVSVARLKAHGITGVKHSLSGRNAELVVKTLFAALFRLGIPGTLLLFDENEQTFVFRGAVPPRRVLQGANLLRRLIDASASGSLVATVAVFAVLPGFVQNCALAYAALGQRLQLARDGRAIGWRSPVIPLDAISTEPDPDAFLTGIVNRVSSLLQHCGVELNGQQPQFYAAGQEVLQQNAGSGYRRALVKRIATLTLQQL